MSQVVGQSSPLRCSRASLTGLVREVSKGRLGIFPNDVAACRFRLVTSAFAIPDEATQVPSPVDVPKLPLTPLELSGNIHVVNVMGTEAFVTELAEFLEKPMLVELRGHFHTELYSLTKAKHFCPTIALSLERLRNTEDMLRVLHSFDEETRDVQTRLRRLIFRHDPLSPKSLDEKKF